MTLYKNRYRVESTRLAHWDYSSPAWYFVAICTKDRRAYFGDVIDGAISLSAIGLIVADEWRKTPVIRPYVDLDEFVVMPNHVHGIVVIKR
jgi:putative transposase